MMDIGECQPLYYVVREFFEEMRMKLDQPVMVHLIDRQALHQTLIHFVRSHETLKSYTFKSKSSSRLD